MPECALLNDVNPHAINFYRWLKRGLVIERPLLNDEDVYYRYRGEFNDLIRAGKHDTREAAELFYYLNRTGYNGLVRFNRSGEFNVPFGRYDVIYYRYDFSDYCDVFRDWRFTTIDFAATPVSAGDFIYADPPYDMVFSRYAKEDFGWSEQMRLVDWLSTHNGPVIISNSATERIISLYTSYGYDLLYVDAPRKISSNGDRTPAREVIARRGL